MSERERENERERSTLLPGQAGRWIGLERGGHLHVKETEGVFSGTSCSLIH